MPSTDPQKRWGRMPINRTKKLTQAEYETGMTAEQLREKQMELKAAAAKRRKKAA